MKILKINWSFEFLAMHHMIHLKIFRISCLFSNYKIEPLTKKKIIIFYSCKLTFKLRSLTKLLTSSPMNFSITFCLSATPLAPSTSLWNSSLPLLALLDLTKLTPGARSQLSLSKKSLALANRALCTHDMLSLPRHSSKLWARTTTETLAMITMQLRYFMASNNYSPTRRLPAGIYTGPPEALRDVA